MIYIDGLGYIDESTYNVNATRTADTVHTSFDSLLAAETAALNNSQKTATNLEDIFKAAADKYNVSLDLLKAIGYNESRFQADATSQAGAMGIMQLMPSTAEALGVTDAYDPYQNIMGAAKLLGQLSDMYDGNQSLILAAYNAGTGNVAKYGGIPPFKETQNYVAKVLASMQSGVDVPDSMVSVKNKADNPAQNLHPSSNLDNIFSYSDYQLLMYYFEHMLEIIASIGGTDSSASNSDDDSLNDLFRLGNSSIRYNRNTINL